MSNPVIKQRLHPLPMLTTNAGLRAFALLLCFLAGAYGYGNTVDTPVEAASATNTHQAQSTPTTPRQAETIGPATHALLSSRQFSSAPARIPMHLPAGGDATDSAADLAAAVQTFCDLKSTVTSQGYAPGTHRSLPSFYQLTGSPRAPPLFS
ncbi:MAG: hypothetical protein WD071_04445 [Pseudohongiella sp.]|uniref:hypothetical protein n=1 Tax=Pseudohongiella sp. TaxID=1979412 RepID=UPI0034A01F2B